MAGLRQLVPPLAAPFVTGAAAIWRARFPGATGKDVRDGLVAGHVTPNRVISADPNSPNKLLYINRSPTAVFSYNCKGTNCTFDGTASEDEFAMTSYAWNFGDGTTATSATAVHTYAKLGVYNTTLTVVDHETLTGSASATVTAINPLSLFAK